MIAIATINTNMTAAAAELLEPLSPEQRKKIALLASRALGDTNGMPTLTY